MLLTYILYNHNYSFLSFPSQTFIEVNSDKNPEYIRIELIVKQYLIIFIQELSFKKHPSTYAPMVFGCNKNTLLIGVLYI